MRKHDEEPDTPAVVLRRRLDGVDSRLARLDVLIADVDAMGRTLAELTAQVRALTEATNRSIFTAPNRAADASAELGSAADGPDDQDGQPNWLTVTDSEVAAAWLRQAVDFADTVLPRFPHGTLPACWPLHPAAVVEVVALQRQYAAAYDIPDPGAVSELLARWLPNTLRRLSADLGSCDGQRAHQEDGRGYEMPRLNPERVALWWVETRGVNPGPVEAFALTRIT